MTKAIQFEFRNFEFRAVEVDGKRYVCAKRICAAFDLPWEPFYTQITSYTHRFLTFPDPEGRNELIPGIYVDEVNSFVTWLEANPPGINPIYQVNAEVLKNELSGALDEYFTRP